MYFEALNAHREVICLSKARPSYHRTLRGTVRSFSYRNNRKLIKALNSPQFEGHFFFSMAEDIWTLAEWRIGGVSSWQGAGVGFYFITSLSHPWASWGNHHSLQWLHWTLQFRLQKYWTRAWSLPTEAPLHEAGLHIYKLCIRFKYFSLCADVRGIGHSVELFMSSL